MTFEALLIRFTCAVLGHPIQPNSVCRCGVKWRPTELDIELFFQTEDQEGNDDDELR